MPGSTQAIARDLQGRYAVERELGRGGMASVYLAEDLKHHRKVAIKVMHPDLVRSVDAARFLREIGIAAQLSHPHIVPLIDSGEAGGRLYLVTPYVTGGSLRERLEREGPLPLADVLRIAEEAGAGLDFAHRNGFVHRDVKPENILFADGHAVLADFGIARACCGPERGPVAGVGVTEVGIAVGTPEYMSPEAASGDDVDSPADVYSLACVVYEMLTGEPPLKGDGPRATMARQIAEVPRSVRAARPDAPPAMERALARALAKNPADRFQSVADFLAALAAETAEAAPRSLVPGRCVAVLPFVNASPDPENEYLSDGITDELIDALAKVEGLRLASRTSVFALKGKPQDVRAIGALLGASEILEGTVRKAGDRLRITAQLSSTDDGRLLWSQRYDRNLDDVFAIQDEIARTIVTTLRATSFADLAEPAARRYTENVAAYGLYLRGRYQWNKRTQKGVAQGIRYFEQAIAADPGYALAYTGLADSYALQVDYRSMPVKEGFEKAEAYARQALALDDSLAEAHASLAWCRFIYDWDWAGAEAEFRRALELDPRYASAHNWYAFLLSSQGKTQEALVEGLTALELDPASVSIRRTVAWDYYYARRYDQSAYHATRAIAMNPTQEESHRILGMALAFGGRLAEAERTLREARTLPGAGAYAIGALGWVLARVGQRAEAEALLGELEALAAREYVTPVAFGTLLIGLGDRERALDYAERAAAERRGWTVYANVNPLFDSLREEKRFKALVKKMGL
ncbi:MAG TPA: protein kinase [Gemmatimonadales bacterium]|nr:protein kinase [Gemmatimonadales bacterium]